MLAKSSQSVSNVNSPGTNHISVTHKITVQLEVQLHSSEQRISSHLRKSGELEKATALVFVFQPPEFAPFHECRFRRLECEHVSHSFTCMMSLFGSFCKCSPLSGF